MDDNIQNEIWFFRMARDLVRFGQCFSIFFKNTSIGLSGIF